MKKQNKILSVVLFAAVAVLSAAQLLYAADGYYYMAGASAVIIALKTLLMFGSAVFFAVGTASAHRSAIITGEACFSASVLFSMLLSIDYATSGRADGLFVLSSALSLAAVILLIVYTCGGFHNKFAPAVLISASYVVTIISAFFAGDVFYSSLYLTEVVMFSALNVMLIYPDLSGAHRVRTAEVIWLGAATFGIYFLIWEAFLVKNMLLASGRENFKGKAAAFILLAPYRPYFYYTEYEEQSVMKNRGVLLLALSIAASFAVGYGFGTAVPEIFGAGCGLSLCALSILQRDLNNLLPEEVPEEEEEALEDVSEEVLNEEVEVLSEVEAENPECSDDSSLEEQTVADEQTDDIK